MSDSATSQLQLKLEETDVSSAAPWKDDVLGRGPFADALTSLLDGQRCPLILGVHGAWGSGKTFFLKRWRADLTCRGYKAIYFNAWDDDCCGDPLVATLGQLWESLKDGDLKEIGQSIKAAAMPLLTRTVFSAVRKVTADVVDLDEQALKSQGEKAVDEYLAARANREELRRRLAAMAARVVDTTKHPLVFIIDELDRCRPTFAIELLERVKHVFGVPGVVFVLGIDRDQLARAIQAVYGSIDADGYLRRFFDMEFALPAADAAGYCSHLLDAHDLPAFFKAKSDRVKSQTHLEEYKQFKYFFATLAKQMELSLRDIQHAGRLFVFVARSLPDRHYIYPELLATLVLLRLCNKELYSEFAMARCHPAKVIDYLTSFVPTGTPVPDDTARTLDYLEVALYCCSHDDRPTGNDVVKDQLLLLSKGEPLTAPEQLSARVKAKARSAVASFLEVYASHLQQGHFNRNTPSRSVLRLVHQRVEMGSTPRNGS